MGLSNPNTDDLKLDRGTGASQSRPKPKMVLREVADDRTIMRLGDIRQEHRLARELEHELGLPFFAAPPRACVPASWVIALLERMPLIVREDRGEGITCVGNIRLYRLARIVLDGDRMVPVHRDAGSLTVRRKAKLREGLLAETFLLPAIFGRRAEEVRALEAAWARAESPERVKMSESNIAELYRCETDRSRQRRKHE